MSEIPSNVAFLPLIWSSARAYLRGVPDNRCGRAATAAQPALESRQEGRHGRHAPRGHDHPRIRVERSKKFYDQLGWKFDDDVAPSDEVRIVQYTPPGSGASITFGKGITPAAPGSAATALTVSDIQAAHDDLLSRGVEASEMWHGAPFPLEARLPGPDPERTSYGSFFAFADPDGNAWLVQEVTTRHPGRD
jgi:catechol 2,3-dioxygenase-like lactoylglutathione lyase family enzyme